MLKIVKTFSLTFFVSSCAFLFFTTSDLSCFIKSLKDKSNHITINRFCCKISSPFFSRVEIITLKDNKHCVLLRSNFSKHLLSVDNRSNGALLRVVYTHFMLEVRLHLCCFNKFNIYELFQSYSALKLNILNH